MRLVQYWGTCPSDRASVVVTRETGAFEPGTGSGLISILDGLSNFLGRSDRIVTSAIFEAATSAIRKSGFPGMETL